MWSLFLWFIYIRDLIESTAAHQPAVRNRQDLKKQRKMERDWISSGLSPGDSASISTGNEHADVWCSVGWRQRLIFHAEVQCFAALSCEIWNYSNKLMSPAFIAHALINWFSWAVSMQRWQTLMTRHCNVNLFLLSLIKLQTWESFGGSYKVTNGICLIRRQT